MPPAQGCDAAVWDVSGSLTAELVGRLSARRHHVGADLTVTVGQWSNRTLAIGAPKRVTAARLPSIDQALRALVDAHKPGWLAIIGPAAATAGTAQQGSVIRDTRSQLGKPDEPIPTADFHQGTLNEPVGSVLVTDWSQEAAEAAERLGVPHDLLAVLTRVGEAGRLLSPPPSRPVTVAREFGGWVGRLLRPGARGGAIAPRPRGNAVSEALALLLPQRPSQG